MPIYTWKHKKSEKTVDVIRKFDDYEVLPTKEEAGEKEELKAEEWTRVIASNISVNKSDYWGPGKGHW